MGNRRVLLLRRNDIFRDVSSEVLRGIDLHYVLYFIYMMMYSYVKVHEKNIITIIDMWFFLMNTRFEKTDVNYN